VAIRVGTRALWRQLVGWVAAYALVLHAFLAALAPLHIAGHGIGDEASGFELCASDTHSSMPTPGDTPAGTQDCDSHCTLARGPGALLVVALDLASASIIEFVTVSLPRPDEPVPAPTRIRVICEPPRGPPQAA
jgi:hypothetical protein